MRNKPNTKVERYRMKLPREHPYWSDISMGNTGAFLAKHPTGVLLKIIASDGGGWEHVSVSAHVPMLAGSVSVRCPTWEEMCWVKDLFWKDDEAAIQYHPPRSTYVNNHPACLHLWRPLEAELPLPPIWMVGIKEVDHAGSDHERDIGRSDSGEGYGQEIGDIGAQPDVE